MSLIIFGDAPIVEIQGRYRYLFKKTIWLIPIQMIFLSFIYLDLVVLYKPFVPGTQRNLHYQQITELF